jgi:hypothetical protein
LSCISTINKELVLKRPYDRVYVVDISDAIARFMTVDPEVRRPAHIVHPDITDEQFITNLLENIIANFEYENTAVDSALTYIINATEPKHGQNEIMPCDCVYAALKAEHLEALQDFSEDLYYIFKENGIFTPTGDLIADYDKLLGSSTLMLRDWDDNYLS